jgi:CrcB protein
VTAAVVAAVLAAGAVGAVLRWATAFWVTRRPRRPSALASRRLNGVPFAVLLVNVAGSALAGAVLGLAEVGAVSADLRVILLTGFCGGLTTFSTFSVETIQLIVDGRWRTAIGSVSANLVLGIGAAALAYLLTR